MPLISLILFALLLFERLMLALAGLSWLLCVLLHFLTHLTYSSFLLLFLAPPSYSSFLLLLQSCGANTLVACVFLCSHPATSSSTLVTCLQFLLVQLLQLVLLVCAASTSTLVA